jgi:hypothetical protein
MNHAVFGQYGHSDQLSTLFGKKGAPGGWWISPLPGAPICQTHRSVATAGYGVYLKLLMYV